MLIHVLVGSNNRVHRWKWRKILLFPSPAFHQNQMFHFRTIHHTFCTNEIFSFTIMTIATKTQMECGNVWNLTKYIFCLCRLSPSLVYANNKTDNMMMGRAYIKPDRVCPNSRHKMPCLSWKVYMFPILYFLCSLASLAGASGKWIQTFLIIRFCSSDMKTRQKG